ncbi:MAG TPA: alpha/beta hydrolase domain-containing protein, partial [Candidatus Methylomirabilis sp.]
MMSMRGRFTVGVVALFLALSFLVSLTEARITRIEITSREPLAGGMSFGETGPYEKLRGKIHGEVDPGDPLNAVIVDLDKAPLNAGGMVEYATNFLMLKPVDMSKGNGKIFYGINNRGNTSSGTQRFNDAPTTNNPTTAQDLGNGFHFRQGYALVDAGWEGDVLEGNFRLTADYPVATDGGATITAPILVEFHDRYTNDARIAANGRVSLPLSGSLDFASYESISTDQAVAQAELRVRFSDSARPGTADIPPGVVIPTGQWAFARCSKDPVTGVITSVPSTTDICLPVGFSLDAVYQLIYTAKNPQVMGLGYAVTRDVGSFLRNQTADDFGNANPLALSAASPGITHMYAYGSSSTGMYVRDFIYQGFNEDESHRKVFDAMWTNIPGAHKLYLNYAFGQPNPFSVQHRDRYVPDTSFPTSYAVTTDPLTGLTDGILKRPATDPIVIHTDSSTEYWQFRAALVTTDGLGHDIALPDNVRSYFMSGEQHGPAAVPALGICQQLSNPLPRGAHHRAVLVALDAWVTEGIRPPKSRFPRVENGTLVPFDQASTGFPSIPGVVYAGLVNASGERDFGPLVSSNRGLVTLNPPVPMPGGEHVILVTKVDKDGNDIAGVRVPQLEVPIATYTGWNTRAAGFSEGDLCDLTGMYLPFAKTKAERLANGDPRKSLEERYKTHDKYVKQVGKAAR